MLRRFERGMDVAYAMRKALSFVGVALPHSRVSRGWGWGGVKAWE